MDRELSLAPGLKRLRGVHRGAGTERVVSEDGSSCANYKKDTATNMASDEEADANGRGGDTSLSLWNNPYPNSHAHAGKPVWEKSTESGLLHPVAGHILPNLFLTNESLCFGG